MPPSLAIASALALGSFGLYFYTAAPDLTLVDSAELALACTTGGVAHPPGFPLYLIIGRFFSLLPLSTPAQALNLMSAFFGALSVGSVFLTVERILACIDIHNSGERLRRFSASATAALILMTSRNSWTWSGVTEVYTLNLFLLTGALASAWSAVYLIFFKNAEKSNKKSKRERRSPIQIPSSSYPWVYAACAFASLGLANHYPTAAIVFPVLLLMLLLTAPKMLRRRKFLIAMSISLFGSLSLYLYLFIASQRDPALGWGGIKNFSLLLRHVAGFQYQTQAGFSISNFFMVTEEFFKLLFFDCGIPALVLTIVGIPLSFRFLKTWRMRGLTLAIPGLLIVMNLILSSYYRVSPEDRMSYDLPATVSWCLLVGISVWAILSLEKLIPAYLWIVGILILLPGWNLARNFKYCNFHHEKSARIFVQETLDSVPNNSVIFTSEWNFYGPYLYMRHLENYRPDLRVIDVLLMKRFWYSRYLERSMPHLIRESKKEFEAFKEQVIQFDLGRHYDKARIQHIYETLIIKWAKIGQETGGAFVDWASTRNPKDLSWIKTFPTAPDGLLLRLEKEETGLKPKPISPKDRKNLRYLRTKLTRAVLLGDLKDLLPRHNAYWRVWINYQRAVEASLLVAAISGGERALKEFSKRYRSWYREIDLAIEAVRKRLEL